MMLCGLIELLSPSWFNRMMSSGSQNRMLLLILAGLALNFAVSGYWWTRSAQGLRREFRTRAGLPLGKPAKA